MRLKGMTIGERLAFGRKERQGAVGTDRGSTLPDLRSPRKVEAQDDRDSQLSAAGELHRPRDAGHRGPLLPGAWNWLFLSWK